MKTTDKIKDVEQELKNMGYDIPSQKTLAFLIGYIPERVRSGAWE